VTAALDVAETSSVICVSWNAIKIFAGFTRYSSDIRNQGWLVIGKYFSAKFPWVCFANISQNWVTSGKVITNIKTVRHRVYNNTITL